MPLPHQRTLLPSPKLTPVNGSVLAWPAWLRMIAVAPVLILLWLAVWWASLEATPL